MRPLSLFVFLCLFSASLAAQEFRLAVLPFHITGTPSVGFPGESLPKHLQALSLYLLGKVREFSPLSRLQTQSALKASAYRISRPFDSESRRRYCRYSKAAYVLTGSAYFRKNRLEVDLQSWSCRLGRVIGRSRSSGRLSNLQSLFKTALRRATPFLNPRTTPVPITGSAQARRPLDLAVILDTSGSMLRDTRAIQKALGSISQSVERGSRLGLIFFGEQDQLDILPFSGNWETSLAYLPQHPPGGENSIEGLLRALGTVARYDRWRNERRLAIFTDVPLGSRRQSRLEISLRRLKARGIRAFLFPLLHQSWTDQREWRRIARALSFPSPSVRYGRTLFPVGKPPYHLITSGNRYYKSPDLRKLEDLILSKELPEDLLEPIPTASWSPSELTLESLSQAWPKRHGERILQLGPIVSNLEKVIFSSIVEGNSNKKRYRKVLLKNGKHAFWVRVSSRSVAERMRKKGEFFLGAHFVKTSRGLEALPEDMELRGFSDVPRLLVTTWPRLERTPPASLHGSDTWFLQVRFLEMR